ncbi:MAG TPA: fused MFS/spermidine synthase [Mariprofundaceae bacterium]|nr:fused MFS/spermidine synthase [Mariprofundaceae bacterium]
MTALAYEVLWTRMLSLLFGISIFGVVFTVTAFMIGLGAGSLLGAHRKLSASRAMSWLALLEAGIAVYAVLMPVYMPWLDQWLVFAVGGTGLFAWYTAEGLAVSLVLMLPATAMGMAFPFALRAAKPLHLKLGSMYGANALGGAFGAALPLLLLPWLGWKMSVWLVAGFGGFLACLAYWLARHLSRVVEDEIEGNGRRPLLVDMLAYAGVGAAALILEMVWTRMYGMVLLRTEYVLAVLLLVYLLGIGLGSAFARHLQGAIWYAVLPLGASLLAVAGIYALPSISRWANSTDFSSLAAAMFAEGAVVAVITFPVTLALGAWLPLLVRRSESEHEAGGWWYGANSLGAAVGAVLAGFVLLPSLGAAGALCLAAVLLLVCGMRWVTERRYWLALPILLAIAWPVRQLPAVSTLLPSLQDSTGLSIYEDAVALTHVVEQHSGQRLLLSDLQRMDASTEPTAVTVQKNQARLPLLLQDGPKKVLFLGLGTGITAAGALPFPDLQMTAVELSRGAIRAAETSFASCNDGVTGKMRILHDDARRFLRADRQHYDVIIGDLFHPDMAGRANLLSLQQFRRVRERLSGHGVFVQWLALNQFDVPSLKVVMQTFRNVFGHGVVFIDGYRMALVGVKDGQVSALPALRQWASLSDTAHRQVTGGEGLWTWLGRYWGEIPDFHAAVQDEWAPVIEYTLPRVRYAGGVDIQQTWEWLLGWRASAEAAAGQLAIPMADRETFERAWVATSLDVRLWQSEIAGDEQQAIYWARMANHANPADRWPAFALADRMYESLQHGLPDGISRQEALRRILELRPDHEGAITSMLRLAMANGNAADIEKWRSRLQQVSPLARILRQE